MKKTKVALAKRVLKQIEAHPEEWVQSKWRCETGMCFAGWYATLAQREWLIEFKTTRELTYLQDQVLGYFGEYVIVPEGSPGAMSWKEFRKYEYLTERQSRTIRRQLQQRGIPLYTLYIAEVRHFVTGDMGITLGDGNVLFDASNTLPMLRQGVELLAQGKPIVRRSGGIRPADEVNMARLGD